MNLLLQEGRGEATDISASPGRQAPANQLRPKEPPPMVIQSDFRKVFSSEIVNYQFSLKHMKTYEDGTSSTLF